MLLLAGGVIAYLYFFGDKEYETVVTNKNAEGHIYTERLWEWSPNETRDVLEYVKTYDLQKVIIPMHIDSSEFIDIEIPDTKVINDYGKTIWAVDGSFTIRLIGNATIDNMTKLAGISNPTVINEYTICSDSSVKGKKVIARLVGTTCILAEVYTNNSTYSILRDTLSSESLSSYEYKNDNYRNDAKVLDEVSYTGHFCSQISMQEISLVSHRYLFEEGFLWEQYNMVPFYSAERQLIAKLEKMSGKSVEEYYVNGQLLFAKAGDYYLGLVAYNSNTTLSLLGQGDEALCNIATALNQLQ